MTNPELRKRVVKEISSLWHIGVQIVLVHGGGPFIQSHLDRLNIESHFVMGQRHTTQETITEIQMVLKGQVNSDLVSLFNQNGIKAVGLSGKDGSSVKASILKVKVDGKETSIGQVGSVNHINTELIQTLLDSGFLPILAPIAIGPDGQDLNVNADAFAGHLAGALNATELLVLTDIDGLLADVNNPDTIIKSLRLSDIERLRGQVIKGGMIPKVDACMTAVESGAGMARIINGQRPELIQKLLNKDEKPGTTITR